MKDKISQAIKESMKKKDALRLSTLRMILAEFQRKEKEKGQPVDDATANQLLQSMVRKRKEAIEQFQKGGREDLAEKEQSEVKIIEEYLPEQLSDEDIREHVRSAIDELGVTGPKEMGKIMGFLTKKLSGSADGATISRIVREELQNLTA